MKHLMRQAITLATSSGKDRYGRESFGSGSTVYARMNEKTKDIFKPNGEVITIEANCYVPSDTTVSVDDKVTYNSNDYKVYTKKIVRDSTGSTHHIKLQLVKWST